MKNRFPVAGALVFLLLAGVAAGFFLWKGDKGTVPSLTEQETVPEFVFTYAENQPKGYPTTQGAEYFAELVYERTDGRIKINVFSGAELGDELSVIEQIQYGGIDFARLSVQSTGELVPQMNVLQLPYLYRDGEHMWQVLDGEIGDEFLSYLDDYGMVGLSWYDAGVRHFYNSVKPIETLEDMRKMRIRVADSDLMEAMINALGAKAVRMAYSEVYAGLETGIIDGAENNFPSYESMRHYEVAGYLTLDGHNRMPETQLASKATWEKLSEEDREIIRSCAEESALYQRQLWDKREQAAREYLEENGCVITELSQKERLRFRVAMMTVYQEYCSEYIDLVNRITETY